MEARVAVLEEMARTTEQLLGKMDARLVRIEDRQQSDFKWLLGMGIAATSAVLTAILGILVTIAHGFHWI